MTKDYSICVGTVGQGVWHSPDGGDTWNRIRDPFPLESQVRALAVHPNNPNVIFAGSNSGIYRSGDRGASWEKLEQSPLDTLRVWAIAIDPMYPDTLFAGTSPPYLFRSRDGGHTWKQLSVEIAQECAIGTPRVTAMLVDPVDHRTVWAGVEIDGVYRSLDGGDTWSHVQGGFNPDIHGMAISRGRQKAVLVSTPRELVASADVGESWRSVVVSKQFPLAYCRHVAVKADDPQVLFIANGDSAIGSTGAIQRSTDGGTTWENLPLPVEPNSPIYGFATHPADPNLVFANSLFGELYRSHDGGDSWEKLKREFSEIRTMAWVPN